MSERAGTAGVIIGFGMGGLLDFIVLHQILQWHHVISGQLPPVALEALQQNIAQDGIWQAVLWALVFAGLFLLFHSIRNSGSLPSALPSRLAFLGYLVIGWGLYNFLEGIVSHHILRLHDVREGVVNPLAWNLGFLLIAGILLSLVGWWMVRAGQKTSDWA